MTFKPKAPKKLLQLFFLSCSITLSLSTAEGGDMNNTFEIINKTGQQIYFNLSLKYVQSGYKCKLVAQPKSPNDVYLPIGGSIKSDWDCYYPDKIVMKLGSDKQYGETLDIQTGKHVLSYLLSPLDKKINVVMEVDKKIDTDDSDKGLKEPFKFHHTKIILKEK